MSEQDIKELWGRWMKNKINNMKENQGWVERFDKKFVGRANTLSGEAWWVDEPYRVKDFITEEINKAVLEERERVVEIIKTNHLPPVRAFNEYTREIELMEVARKEGFRECNEELLKWFNKLVTMWAESHRHIYSFSRLVPEERMIELLEELQKITK